ncbi:MAG TPA: transcriptional repressor, partial [Bdellovibrio sp.]|nr:transcriptional repressor [Bdellovibrio sp.]
MNSLQERVRAAGMKLTQQRLRLLEILLHHPEPISADEIFKETKQDGMDLVTIYRILKKFEECE